jgi:small subunit ribosomal protein S7
MSRKVIKNKTRKKVTTPDAKYGSSLLAKFINKLNATGKKTTAERIMYGALANIEEKMKEDPIGVFTRAVENVRPLLEVRARRVGGATYQVPMEVPEDRSIALCIRWILAYARARKGAPMATRLATEFMEASRKEGNAMKKREDTHKMAEANKAFAHYKW